MDGDGGGGDRLLLLDVAWTVSPFPLHLSICGTWGSIYIEDPSRKSLFDVAKVVDTDTGGSCPYGCPLNSLEVSFTSPLTWEFWKLIILH
jgi:hypothetical protein